MSWLTMASNVFISHIHEEAPLAASIERVLEGALAGSNVFASGEDVAAGQQWLQEVDAAMGRADVVVVLCSARSCARPWVNFEAGGGWGKSVQVVPVCHSDMTVSDLPFPLSAFQSYQLSTADDLRQLVDALGGDASAAGVAGWADVEAAFAAIDYVPPAVRPLPPPSSERSVLLDLSHGQAEWPQRRRGTLFSWPGTGVDDLTGDPDVEVRPIDSPDQLRAADMAAWTGLVVALPFHTRMGEGAITQIVEWVRAGGRLALLGFELGDLHHGGNLNDLASRFALRFSGDIVAPADWVGQAKPYGADVTFRPGAAAAESPLWDGVDSVTWRNVQTIAREPGTRPLAGVGDNAVAVPTPDSIGFAGGTLTMPAPQFDFDPASGSAAVVAEATPHLTDDGRVLAVGTWDLLPEGVGSPGNRRFAANLLRWMTD